MRRYRLRKRLLRGRHLVVASFATLMGCDDNFVLKYGVPVVERSFAGHVIDSDTGDPIPGIQLSFGSDSALSEADGAWALSSDVPDGCRGACVITATDIDGATNGVFHDHCVTVDDADALEQDGTDVIIEMDPMEDTGG